MYFFFFKQKTAYEMRISDWSSDVCSSDLFGVSGQPAARYNPLDRLDPESLDLAEDAMTLADALVHDSAGQGGEAHWNEEAKALIAGLILYAVVHEDREHRTLARSEEHTSELQSLMRISYAVFCLKQKTTSTQQ